MSLANELLWLQQAGKGKSLLLIHGLLMNGDMFAPVLDRLSKNYRVLAPDLRGFGRSGNLAPPYTVEQHAHDLAQLLKSMSIESTVVLGYSQGGLVAQQLALDYPDLVSRLILCCTFSYNRLTWQEKIEAFFLPFLVRILNAKQLAQMAKGLTPEQSRQIETMIASNQKSRMADAVKIMLRFDSRQRLHEIKCPALIVAGENDSAVPLHHARMLAQGISGAELLVMPNAGHELIWTHGMELMTAIRTFLAKS